MIIFRKAEPKDAPKIAELVNSAYRGESSKIGWTTEADLLGGQRTDPDKILDMILEKGSRIEVASDGLSLVGCVHTKTEADALYFGMLTVEPKLQNSGAGKLLLKRVEEIAREEGLKKIRMTVISVRKELIAYYERRGYKWTGKTEPFPSHDPRFGLPKQELIFHEFEKKLSE